MVTGPGSEHEHSITWGVFDGQGFRWSISASRVVSQLEISSDPLASAADAREFAAALVVAADWLERRS